MAIVRETPYGDCNFLVDLGTGSAEGPQGGFSEVVLPTASIDVIEYRAGNLKHSEAIKIPGRTRTSNVILRRGVNGDLSLYEWWNQVRNGAVDAKRTVTIQLFAEDRSGAVMTWKLVGAWPAKYVGPTLDGSGNDVAIETIELAFDRLEIE